MKELWGLFCGWLLKSDKVIIIKQEPHIRRVIHELNTICILTLLNPFLIRSLFPQILSQQWLRLIDMTAVIAQCFYMAVRGIVIFKNYTGTRKKYYFVISKILLMIFKIKWVIKMASDTILIWKKSPWALKQELAWVNVNIFIINWSLTFNIDISSRDAPFTMYRWVNGEWTEETPIQKFICQLLQLFTITKNENYTFDQL